MAVFALKSEERPPVGPQICPMGAVYGKDREWRKRTESQKGKNS